MAKAKAAMFLLAILLCSTFITILAARPEPGISSQQKSGEAGTELEAVEENCGGVGEEECLLRRTLAAHTDYIYSQKHNEP